MILVNSNPATIMTDPEYATQTYHRAAAPGPGHADHRAERPDALLPTLGGQTALNLAKELTEDGTLERFGVELIGANYDAINRAEDRNLFRETMNAAGLRVPGVGDRDDARRGPRRAPATRPPGDRPAGVHARRPGRGDRADGPGVRRARRPGDRRVADRPGPRRGVGPRVGGVRAGGDARPQRQRRDRLLDREHRPDGRPHGRLGDGRAPADADRPPVPAAARPGDQGDPGGRRRDRRVERPVRGQPGRRTRSS